MKKIILLFLFASLFSIGGFSQISYDIDTSGLSAQRGADTIFTIDSKLETKLNFRFQQSETSGIILVKTAKTPSISIFDSTTTKQNVLYPGKIEIADKILLKSVGVGDGGEILVRNSEGEDRVKIFSERTTNDGGAIVELYNSKGERTFFVSADDSNKGGTFELRDSLGNTKLAFRSNYNNTGDSRIITDEIQIDGGSDLAELFDITDAKEEVEPGLLVSLDPDNPGKLMLSNERYDRKIAGVLSGANGVKPGILMGQDKTIATGDNLVTLSGRTFVKANTTNGSIKVGDLITTSDISGEAMKATKRRKSKGAVIGKAMTELESGTGYVLVLINLQ